MSRFEALFLCYISGQMSHEEFEEHRREDEMFNSWVINKHKQALQEARNRSIDIPPVA